MEQDKRIPIGLKLSPGLLHDLDAYVSDQRLPTTRTAVIEFAVREFLNREVRGKQRATR